MVLELIDDIVYVAIEGGEKEKFVEFIPKNHRYFERNLHILMIKSGEELDWVIDALFSARKIKTLLTM
jgi:hypothetical protein